MTIKKGIRISLWILPLVVFFIYIKIKGFEYPVVDDVMINQTILAHEKMLLPYVGIMLSALLVFIQSIFSAWNIYFIFLVFAFCGSISIFNDFFFKKKLYILIPLTILMECVLIKYFSFSVISYMLATAGILLILNTSIPLGSIITLIGVSIRPQIISSLVVLLLPFLIYEVINNRKWKRIVLIFGIMLGVVATNKAYIMIHPKVNDYLTWNELSTNLRDFPEISYVKHQEEFQQLGVSENDLYASTFWIFAEKDELSNELIEKIQSVRPITEKYSFDFSKFYDDYFKNAILSAFLFIFIGWFVVFKPKSIWGWGLPWIPFVLIIGLFVRQRVVERVFIPIMVCFLMFFLIYAQLFYTKRRFLKNKWSFLILQCILAIVGFKWLNQMTEEWYWFPEINSSFNATDNRVVKNYRDKLIIFGGYGDLVNSQTSLASFKVYPGQLFSNTTTLGNWQTFSPRYSEILEPYNIENKNNLISSAIDNDHVIFYWPTDTGKIEVIKTLMKEHYQKDVYFEEIGKVGKNMSIFKLKSR